MKNHFLKISFVILFSITHTIYGQSSENVKLPEAKKLIDKIEVLAGPNLSFNYGNMFIENYRGEYTDNNYIVNKRLLKPGYVLGVGVYHPLSNRIDLNIRFLFEKKGTKNELNNPLNPVNDYARQIRKSNYTYSYATIEVQLPIYIGDSRKWIVSFGTYFSKVKNVKGFSEIYNTRDYQVDKGKFEGRYFYHFRDDGGIDGFSWKPHLTGIENNDWGLVTSIGHRIHFNQKHSVLVQVQDNLGLKNINKNNTYGLEEKNQSLSLIISYTYHLHQKSLRL